MTHTLHTLARRAFGAALSIVAGVTPAHAQQSAPLPLDTISPIVFPKPSGPYAVGARRFHWIDSSRAEIGTEDPGDRRELVVRLWYPALRPGVIEEPYLPQLSAYRALGSIGPRTTNAVPRVRHAATSDAVPNGGPFAIVVFSTGNGEMEYMYTSFVEELASHGYAVALIAHPGIADVVYPNGRTLKRYRRMFDPKPEGWEASLDPKLPANLKRALYDTMYTESADYLRRDVSLVLDQFAALNADARDPLHDRLDMNRIATAGHSHGGLIAVETCARDARVKACMQMDGAAFGPIRDEGLTKPYLLFRPAFDNDGTPRGVAQNQIFGSLRADGYEVNIHGAQHRSFMDAHFLMPDLRGEAIAPERVLAIMSAYSRAFLERHLFDREAPLLDARSPSFGEVSLRSVKFDFAQPLRAARRN